VSYFTLRWFQPTADSGPSCQDLGTNPRPQKLPIAPIFIADKVSLAVSRNKTGNRVPFTSARTTGRIAEVCRGRRRTSRDV
jgi:hypothetical protein